MPADIDEQARHKAKMANRKAVQDAEVADKTVEKGLLIVHTGKGKGKSTAAWGLLLRAVGRLGDQVEWHTLGEGFTWETQDRNRDVEAARRAWAKTRELMANPAIRL